MKKIIPPLILLLVFLVGFSAIIQAGEKEVIRALEVLRNSVGVSDKKYNDLFREATVELNILERTPGVNKDFLELAKSCHREYGRVIYFSMMAKETGVGAERNRQPADEIRSAMQTNFEARRQCIENGSALLDKLYTLSK